MTVLQTTVLLTPFPLRHPCHEVLTNVTQSSTTSIEAVDKFLALA
jgi:hypothetical protein